MKIKYIPIILILIACTNIEYKECSLLPTTTVAPIYPMPSGTTADLHTCHEGHVTVEYIISKSGSVINPRIIDSTLIKGCRNQSASEDFFHQASLDAISKFKYKPISQACIAKNRFVFKNEL